MPVNEDWPLWAKQMYEYERLVINPDRYNDLGSDIMLRTWVDKLLRKMARAGMEVAATPRYWHRNELQSSWSISVRRALTPAMQRRYDNLAASVYYTPERLAQIWGDPPMMQQSISSKGPGTPWRTNG